MADDKPQRKSGRRRFLKSVGVVSAGLSIPALTSGTAAAVEDDVVGTDDVGITDTVRRYIANQEVEKAIELLSKYDVRFDANTSYMPDVGTNAEQSSDVSENTSRNLVTPLSEWNKGNSSLTHVTHNLSGNRYLSYMAWTLRTPGGGYETSGPPDAAGITVNPDAWSLIAGSWFGGDRTSLKKRGSKGVIYGYNDPENNYKRDSASGYMSVKLRKTERGRRNVFGTYVHTWNPGGVPGGVSFSLAVGPIGVSTSGRVDTWTKRNDDTV